MSEKQRTPGWVWAAFGCIFAAFAAAVFFVVVFVFGARKVREFEADLKDPVSREERVLEVLGADAMPDGFYPMVGFSLPFVFDMAMMTTTPPDESGEMAEGLGDEAFIYFKMLGRATQEEELYDFFEGKTNDPTVLRRQNISVNVRKLLDRGVIERDDTTVLWVVNEGTFGMGGGSARDGLATLMLFQCPGQKRLRMGIWMAPGPEAPAEGEELELTGTAGDPAEIEALVAGFRPCPTG
ncbi:MAG: hypothetical protein AAGA81_14940 [Acidobacteriota bacterium]